MATAASPAPRRARALQIDTPVKPVANGVAASKATPEMVKLAQEVIIANAEKNTYTSKEKKSKESLNKLMIAGDVDKFTFTTEVAGAFQTCEAVIAESTAEYIDVQKLRGLVDNDTFMKIVKATKGETEKLAGQNIVLKCTATETKPASLTVSKVKA